MTDFAPRRAAFRALHRSGCFVLPNPWDGGTAIRLAKRGFQALASTSAGAAWALGKEDGALSVDEVLAHLSFLVGITDLPVNADFEAGFAVTPDGVGRNVTRCIETGVAGLSIEDRDGDRFYPVAIAAERIRAARAAIDRSGQDVILVGRCEAYLMAKLDLDEVIVRLKAYAQAGADCLYAPGLTTLADLTKVVEAVDKPVNANLTATGLSVADMAAIGIRRVSVGAALAKATYAAFDSYADLLAQEGRLP
ncbi:isocitrate lyase/PEP mutase family protein [Lichenifustis flavocetrariae]|uniref:Isocitrate lyase/phosphoenolpyruvate mutase family protein n=1 Tax=Lichenifustis flavocetrariae TaxID=2949735 RepID=A0AA41YWM6_9HYPH|nr:isocitrate lyase/phosphoenolpyruvate mutase family protein [Lichenifustis flavocetrariae]MCW6509944.1 isocitrate lyase/phosphoenolpyruvate mutase family protein [Lichenifustis flavocetrariae]